MSGQRMNRPTRFAVRGFTLIELLLVLVILAVLAAVVIPKLTGRVEDAKLGSTITQISMLKGALNQFEIDNGRFPSTSEGLDALVNCPSGLTAPPWRKSLDEVPLDGWGSQFDFRGGQDASDGEFDIISAGPDKQFGTADDLNKFSKK